MTQDTAPGATATEPARIEISPADGYAGDIPSPGSWALLAEDPAAQLLDVRSQAEWQFVGMPDLTALQKSTYLVAWANYPGMQIDAGFVDQVRQAGLAPEAPLHIICRSGQRSRNAAQVLTAAGFRQCLNVSDGFEGPIDAAGHRGTIAGWRFHRLPWRQS